MARKNTLTLMSTSEIKIYEAVNEVEKIGADVRLTKAITLMQQARDLVAEVIDEQIKQG